MVETCFALWAVFREDLNLKVLVLFATLLFVKIFHWLAIMRVDNVSALHMHTSIDTVRYMW